LRKQESRGKLQPPTISEHCGDFQHAPVLSLIQKTQGATDETLPGRRPRPKGLTVNDIDYMMFVGGRVDPQIAQIFTD
jgi:hypothetical protein